MDPSRAPNADATGGCESSSGHHWSQLERDDLRQIFSLFDTNNTGHVRAGELLSVLQALQDDNGENNRPDPHRNLQRLVTNLRQRNHDDQLDFDAFCQLMHHDPKNKKTEMQAAFDLFDRDGKGYIETSDLRRVANLLGESMDEDDLQAMVARAAASSGSGGDSHKVYFADFERVMKARLIP